VLFQKRFLETGKKFNKKMSEQIRQVSFEEFNETILRQLAHICSSIIFHQHISQLLPDDPYTHKLCVINPNPKQPDLGLEVSIPNETNSQAYGYIDFNYRFNKDGLNTSTENSDSPVDTSKAIWGEPTERESTESKNNESESIEYDFWGIPVEPIEQIDLSENEELIVEEGLPEEDLIEELLDDDNEEPFDLEAQLTDALAAIAPDVVGELAGDYTAAQLISLGLDPVSAFIAGEAVGQIAEEVTIKMIEAVQAEAEELAKEAAERAEAESIEPTETEEFLDQILEENSLDLSELAAELELTPADLQKMSVGEIETILKEHEAEREREAEELSEFTEFEAHLTEIANELEIPLSQLYTILEVENTEQAIECTSAELEYRLAKWEQMRDYKKVIEEVYDTYNLNESRLLLILEVRSIEQACELGEDFLKKRVEEWRLETAILQENAEFQEELKKWEYSIRTMEPTKENIEAIITKLRSECAPLRAEFLIKKTEELAKIELAFNAGEIEKREYNRRLNYWKSDGNFAIGHIYIEGKEPLTFKAFSDYRKFGANDSRFAGSDNPGKGFTFVTEGIQGKSGLRSNEFDTERMISEALDRELKGDTSIPVEGTFYTELIPCEGCERVRVNIRKKYPNASITFVYGSSIEKGETNPGGISIDRIPYKKQSGG
jgi:hypothetical protein